MAGVNVVARRLKQARLRRGISQRDLGIRAGMDPSSASARINQYERGKHVPDLGTAARLSRILDVPSPYLYAQDDALAAWILVFARLSPAARHAVLRKAPPPETP
jgi:transcriptional regulator with XRE-family HTH domain